MNRRLLLQGIPASLMVALGLGSMQTQAGGAAFPPVVAVQEPHFPSRLYQFVWRNWELANLNRMAEVVGAHLEQLVEIGAEMGLPAKRVLSEDYRKRIYITLIRQNWHLLPEQQIIQMLGWTQEAFDFALKEDDFLDHKLGKVKPACEPLRYATPTRAERRAASDIRKRLHVAPGDALPGLGVERFSFVRDFDRVESLPSWTVQTPRGATALRQAAARFRARGATQREIDIRIDPDRVRAAVLAMAPDADVARDSGSFVIKPEGTKRAIITAASERAAIRALYQLRGLSALPTEEAVYREIWPHRFLYSYFALYGDPLMEGDAAGLPDGYLDRAAANGMNGVWIQGLLNNLAPSRQFPEFGKGWQTRLAMLRDLVERAQRFGLRVYLYLNEPRAMPEAFYQNRSGIRGTKSGDVYSMCTSTQQVRDWLQESVAHVFRETPGLGGLFTITMSENQTNCFSNGGGWGDRDPVAKGCPRCSQRSGAETIAELLQCIRDGVREHSADAEIMAYDWGWGTPLAAGILPRLPKDTSIISISEWSKPVTRGGVSTEVGEYSMSVVGPGPRATQNWELARKHGVASIAKTQFNNTWEISAVPYIPVLPLVLDHCENLAKLGLSGVMASWTCGGFPSPNLRAAAAFGTEPRPPKEAILRNEARRMYGEGQADAAIQAWHIFSDAFQEFPYGVSIYVLPLQHGPANLLRLQPTGLRPGMILFPYDAYQSWKGAYPPSVVQSQMAKLAKRWSEGVTVLEQLAPAPGGEARLELAVAQTCLHHFESVANQLAFYLLRAEFSNANPERQGVIRTRLIAIAQREKALAQAQFAVASAESLIGYEASNHYYYTPIDLLEKVLNCDQVIAEIQSGARIGVSAQKG